MTEDQKFEEEMKGVLINNYHDERRWKTKNPDFAHWFNTKAGNMPRGVIVK